MISPSSTERQLAKILKHRFQAYRSAENSFKKALLEDTEFEILSQILSVNYTIGEEFMQRVSNFYRCHGKEEELVEWAVHKEINDTENSNELFRMQSFATQLVFNIFFGDRGKNYLLNTVAILVGTVLSCKPEKLELVPNGITVSVEESEQNLDFVLKILRNFFSLVELKLYLLPRVIRRAFVGMKHAATAKFPEIEYSIVPSFFFLRCLCPTLTQPDQFGIAAEKPEGHTHTALIMISKILQNIANGIIKNNISTFGPQNELLLAFIEDSIQVVKQICDKLSDNSLITSRTEIQYSTEEQTKSFEELCSLFLTGDLYQHLEQLTSKPDIKEHLLPSTYIEKSSLDVESFLKKMEDVSDSDWKTFKESQDIIGFISRTDPLLYKLSGKIYRSLPEVFVIVNKIPANAWFDMLKDKCVVSDKCYILMERNEHNVERWSIKVKLPFPYTSKRVGVEKSFLEIDQNQFAVVIKSLPESQIQFGLTVHFHNLDEITRYDTIYKLTLTTHHFTQPSLIAIGKDLHRAFDRFNQYINGSAQKHLKKKAVILTSSAGVTRPKSMSMKKFLWSKSDSNEENPCDSSTTGSTTTSNSGKSPQLPHKSFSGETIPKKKLISPMMDLSHSPPTTCALKSNDGVPNRSLSDDNFAVDTEPKSPSFTPQVQQSPETAKKSISRGSSPQLINTNPNRKAVTPVLSRIRRHSDLRMLPPPKGNPKMTLHQKDEKPRSKPAHKNKNQNLFEQSEDLTLISDDELKREERDNNILLRASEDSSPDLLSISD